MRIPGLSPYKTATREHGFVSSSGVIDGTYLFDLVHRHVRDSPVSDHVFSVLHRFTGDKYKVLEAW